MSVTKDQLTTDDAKELVGCVAGYLQLRGYAACVLPQAAGTLLLANAMSVLEEHGHSEEVIADIERAILALMGLVLRHVRDYDRDVRKLQTQEKMS